MRVTRLQTLLAFLCLLLFSAFSVAEEYYIDITNKTGYTIMEMYVSPEDSTGWEEDVLGSSVLRPHKARRINLTGYSNPSFDIQLVDEDGDTYTFWKVDVSQIDLVVPIEDID